MSNTAVKALIFTLLVLFPPLSSSLQSFVGSNKLLSTSCFCLKPCDLPKVNVYGGTPITHASLPFFFSFSLREPVSCFPEDSIYAVLPPQVGKNSQEVFEGHVMTGQGQVRALCREDMLMYREYIKNRYMWDTDNTDWISVTSVNGKHDQLLKMFRRH